MNNQINMLSVDQTAEILQVHPETIRRLAHAGKIPSAKVGRKWVFIQQDLAQYIRNQYSTNKGVAQVVDKDEESLCQFTNETPSGGLNSQLQMEDEYGALLGLKTDD